MTLFRSPAQNQGAWARGGPCQAGAYPFSSRHPSGGGGRMAGESGRLSADFAWGAVEEALPRACSTQAACSSGHAKFRIRSCAAGPGSRASTVGVAAEAPVRHARTSTPLCEVEPLRMGSSSVGKVNEASTRKGELHGLARSPWDCWAVRFSRAQVCASGCVRGAI